AGACAPSSSSGARWAGKRRARPRAWWRRRRSPRGRGRSSGSGSPAAPATLNGPRRSARKAASTSSTAPTASCTSPSRQPTPASSAPGRAGSVRRASALGLPLGVSPPPVLRVRGQIIVLRGGLDAIPRPLYSRRGYVVPRVDGRVLAGSTLEDAGYEKRVTAGAAADILAAACAMAPAGGGLTLVNAYAGHRPAP